MIVKTLEEAKKVWEEIPVGKALDIRNQKFNKLLVLYRTSNKREQPMFVCKCDCGNYTVQNGYQIRTSKVKSCGCWRKERLSLPAFRKYQQEAGRKRGEQVFVDYTNKKIGKITFTKIVDKDIDYIWEGVCECGKKIHKHSSDIGKAIKKGVNLSCGCYQYNELDLTNQRFGKLIAIKKQNNKYYGGNLWYCKCDCGNFTSVKASALKSGNTQSCGCLNSKNESIIAQLLDQLKLIYKSQFHYKDCIGRFDFLINNNYIIEYDGIQHFKYTETGWNTKENFERTRKSDLIKNKYCFDNNIPIIRIPYDAEYDLNDLKLETTRFLLTPKNEKEYYESRMR